MKRRLPLLLAITSLVLTAGISRALQTPAKHAATAPVVIPFDQVNKHIVLKTKVNNSRPLSFVLDTGDKFAIINLDRAKELGLELQGEVRMGGAGAALSMGAFVKNASFTLDGFEGFTQPITMALPIGSLSSRMGRDFDGILGSDFIQEFVVELDYLAGVIRLHNKEKFSYSGPGESIPIELNHGHPLLVAEVTPQGRQPLKGKFVLDIGAGLALALYSPFVNQNNLLGPDSKTIKALSGAGAGGETSGRLGRVTELKIGRFKIADPLTLFSQDKAGAFASPSLAGNIGALIARRFRVFLDYQRSRIILEPNEKFADPFDRALPGMSVVAEGNDYKTFRIREVLEGSAAAMAGFAVNDVILSIDGKDVAGLTLSRINELFEKPITYKLVVKRGEETKSLPLTPRRLEELVSN